MQFLIVVGRDERCKRKVIGVHEKGTARDILLSNGRGNSAQELGLRRIHLARVMHVQLDDGRRIDGAAVDINRHEL